MAHHLQNAIKLGDTLKLQEADLSYITATKNTALHIAVQYEKAECVELILRRCPSLLWSQNVKGDTALHIAARLCSSSITKLLLLHEKKAIDESDVLLESGGLMERSRNLVRVLNKENDTALHEAARNGCKKTPEFVENDPDEVGRMLIEADHEYEYTANAAGETPLYLAAENVYGSLPMVEHILEVWPSAAHDGPNGMTALHAAAKWNNEDVVNILLAKKPVISGQADNDGWTALHYAVCHSSTSGLDLLIKLCPECQEVVDNEGRSYLHIAIMRGNLKLVKHIYEGGYLTKVIINQPDNYGNTPLHLAAIYKKWEVIIYLLKEAYPLVSFRAINKENLTSFGIIDKVNIKDVDGSGEKYTHAWQLLLNRSRMYRGRIKLEEESDATSQTVKEMLRQMYNKRHKKRKEKFTQKIQDVSNNHLVVATLIATVAFAAGFALPGGYQSDGKATLLRQTCFEAFAISNTVAMSFSSFAVVIHFVLKLIENESRTSDLIVWAFLSTLVAIIAMMVAFVTGTYSVLADSPGLAISVCAIGCTFTLFSGLLVGKHYDDIEFPF